MKVSAAALALALFIPVSAAQVSPPPAEFLPQRSAFVHPDTSDDMSWHASWIGLSSPSHPNQWTCFRRTVSLDALPGRAIARIAADSKYWLWINGQLVVREGGLKRGPTPTDTYFDEVDVRSFLRPGSNTFAILVWHFGKHGFSHRNSGASALLFQLDTGDSSPLVVSDSTWRATAHPSFGDTAEPHPNFRLPESNIRFDAALDLVDWQMPAFDDRHWSAAVDFGRAPRAPWNRLVRRPIPLWRETNLLDYTAIESAPPLTVSASDPTASLRIIKARLPHNAHVTPYFEIDAPAGLTVAIQTDHYLGGGAPNVRAEYITRAGRQSFECYGWMNGHEVHYTIPAGVKILRLAYRESGYDTDFAGTFHCDDPFLVRLRDKAARTLYVTMRDTYMDCPDRERAQWWGDVVNELGETFYALDRRSDALTRKAILELIGWQKPDGVLYSPIPEGNWDKDLPLQMLASVSRAGFWTYGFYSGDFETLRAAYPGAKRYLEIWDLLPSGLVRPRPGGWPWGDWGENVDMVVLANAWYHLALQGLREMAVALDQPGDLPWIDARLTTIAAAFNPTFWNGREYRSPEHTGSTDDRANALAVVAGLAEPHQFPALLEVFRTQEHASPYMEKYVLEALCLMNEPSFAQDRMRRRFAKMVNDPHCTTLWEGWGIGEEGYGGGSTNHAWSGGPLTIMSQYFAGIAPTSPGFATFAVLPQPGDLRHIQANVASPRGEITADFTRRDRTLSLSVTVPTNTRAEIGFPVTGNETITRVHLNGTEIWPNFAADAPPGITPLGVSRTRHLRFAVLPGRWQLDAHIQPATSSP